MHAQGSGRGPCSPRMPESPCWMPAIRFRLFGNCTHSGDPSQKGSALPDFGERIHTHRARTQHSSSHARTKPTLRHGHSQTPQPQGRLTMRRASSAKSAAALRPWPSANRNFHIFLPIAYLRSGPGRDEPGESTGGVTRRRREGARSATGFDAPPHAAARTEADVLVQFALHKERALPRILHAVVPASRRALGPCPRPPPVHRMATSGAGALTSHPLRPVADLS